ncbi:hypothetical protein CesoFtcFv8_005605 [Champsocephalus esox]|uniref:Uncharacterized protein n=1 Tax=Champsocephalus esox TaxID=159716 RepID=A0AAN8HA83_9TELE|nr:hypothetical protein CesoFtcFv8_005605 [Champsocephalus esox]
MASGQDLCRMHLHIKWWKKKKSLSWNLLRSSAASETRSDTTPRWTSDAVKLKRADLQISWSSDPPLPRTLLSPGPWTQWQEQEVMVMMQEVLGGQRKKAD